MAISRSRRPTAFVVAAMSICVGARKVGIGERLDFQFSDDREPERRAAVPGRSAEFQHDDCDGQARPQSAGYDIGADEGVLYERRRRRTTASASMPPATKL